MSDGSEFHSSDAATGKERRLTVVSRNGCGIPLRQNQLHFHREWKKCQHGCVSLGYYFGEATVCGGNECDE